MDIKIGLELEFHIIDEYGKIKNDADLILAHRYNDNGHIVSELSKSMVEVIAKPSHKLDVVCDNFKQELHKLKKIADSYGLKTVPSSSIGPKPGILSNDDVRPRGMKKRMILGDTLRDLEHHICGTHIHVDHLEDKEKLYKQYLVMQAMDPLFAFMSSTPFLLGNNTKKDYRVDIYRNIIFKDYPLHGQLLGYPESLDHIAKRQEEGYAIWEDLMNAKGYDMEGFQTHDVCWGPLRLCPKTTEARAFDANVFSRVMTLASLYQGAMMFINEENPDIEIEDEKSQYSVGELFVPKDGKMILPSYARLKDLEARGVQFAMSDPQIHQYLSNIYKTAILGQTDKSYLEPFTKSLDSKRTFSDDIIDYARVHSLENDNKVNEKDAAQIRLYIADQYKKDLMSK